MRSTDILIIVATLLGPILAVQAQKWVEVLRERRHRKLGVFHTLMATRAARLSAEHVQALNMIDLAFYGRRLLGNNRRTKREQAVLDAWHEYLDHLNPQTDANSDHWPARNQELFVNLLHVIAQDVDFSFDRVQLKNGIYTPVAHGKLEQEQELVRGLVISVLSGDRALKVEVAGEPPAA